MTKPVDDVRADGAQTHVEAFERYAELLALQIESLIDDDLARFEQLAAECDETARDVDAFAPLDDQGHTTHASTADSDALMDALHRCRMHAETLQQQIRTMRGQTLTDVIDLDHARRAAHAYGNASAPNGSLDVDL